MHTDETDDLGDAPPMPPEGTRVRIKPDEAAAVARQTLDDEPSDSDMVALLRFNLTSAEGRVTRSAHTNGDIRVFEDSPVHDGYTVFAYGAQVEEIE
jgi:hypothetical protein